MNIDHLDLLIAQGQPSPKPQCQCVVYHFPSVWTQQDAQFLRIRKGARNEVRWRRWMDGMGYLRSFP